MAAVPARDSVVVSTKRSVAARQRGLYHPRRSAILI